MVPSEQISGRRGMVHSIASASRGTFFSKTSCFGVFMCWSSVPGFGTCDLIVLCGFCSLEVGFSWSWLSICLACEACRAELLS